MRSALRYSVPVVLAVVFVVAASIWLRSYWRVDKFWVQVLPKVALEARLTPGQITFGSTQSSVRLPIGDVHWFSWPVDSYFADFIPPPSNTLFCEFLIYNGTVTIPLWFVALLAAMPNLVFMTPLVRFAASSRYGRAPVRPVAIAPGVATGSLLRPNHPLIAVGQGAAEVQSASVMQVVS